MAELIVKSASKVTAEDVKARVEATLQAIYERPAPEVAEPVGIWNLFAIGPFAPTGASPWSTGALNANQVITVGETFFIVTVLVAGPEIASFHLPYKLRYSTGDLDTWASQPAYGVLNSGFLIAPNIGPFSVTIDVAEFVAGPTGCFETNICAQIFTCDGKPALNYAGFVRVVLKLDPESPTNPGTGSPLPFVPSESAVVTDTGIRFQVYQP